MLATVGDFIFPLQLQYVDAVIEKVIVNVEKPSYNS